MRVHWLFALALVTPELHAAHAYSQFGDVMYPPDFPHFRWVNPNAPKGGEIELVPPLRITNFDKFNPFTLRGTAPPGLSALVFESLLTGTFDEPTTAYGLLAEDVSVAHDGLSVVFRLNPNARFQDGTPVTAADVKHSFDTLMSKQAAPGFRFVFADVKQAVVIGPLSVRFEFKHPGPELPLMVGGIPVFSRAWGAGKPFDQVISEYPIASGPYKIGRMNFGRDITYERDPNYWARDLNVRRGMYNFDRVTYKIYKDNTAQTEAFRAGEFDYIARSDDRWEVVSVVASGRNEKLKGAAHSVRGLWPHPADPDQPFDDETATMEPRMPCSAMCRATYFVLRKLPIAATWTARQKNSALSSSTPLPPSSAALLTRMSMCPCSATSRST
jgi:microcin C transport system substrate-binding protein